MRTEVMKLERKRVLITGGSSGIGFAIAHALLAKDAKVAITGRRAAVSRPLRRSYARPVDLTRHGQEVRLGEPPAGVG
jgi:NAD(P)-dependent dehydrogenase (short-subunit alcohol dehydrogenase family)